MSKQMMDLLQLDVEKLFEERKIEEIVEIEQILEGEIEKKRLELRSMVGDRYKDVLTASDEIINMHVISDRIVRNIDNITERCKALVSEGRPKIKPTLMPRTNNEDLSVLIQIRVIMLLKEEIWYSVDKQNYSDAAQFYLLAQHIFTGLKLLPPGLLSRLPILHRIGYNIDSLKNRIFNNIRKKLQAVILTVEDVVECLIALILLNDVEGIDLLRIFIEHRKTAVSTINEGSYPNVRMKISLMVQCFISTIQLLHNCFIGSDNSNNALIWKHLAMIASNDSSPTFSKLTMPSTPLICYLPEIVTNFKPKCIGYSKRFSLQEVKTLVDSWLNFTKESTLKDLRKSLEVITSLKGLHLIREEALKVAIPENWESICLSVNLAENFSVWDFFFQSSITERAAALITEKVGSIMNSVEDEIRKIFESNTSYVNSYQDLSATIWTEGEGEYTKSDLLRKNKGYPLDVVKLCEKINDKCLELIKDFTSYIYNDVNSSVLKLPAMKLFHKGNSEEMLQNHLRQECWEKSERLTESIRSYVSKSTQDGLVSKCIVCAKILDALLFLCPNFNKCCTFNSATEEWTSISDKFCQISLELWQMWIKRSAHETEHIIQQYFKSTDTHDMLKMLLKWETFEIQEQTDESVFKSQIKIPGQPSLYLQQTLTEINMKINAVLPHTVPRQIHVEFIECNVEKILVQYDKLLTKELNQVQALQFLYDVKFISTLCVPKGNIKLMAFAQKLADGYRSKIDPFDLDVFYSYLQNNIKRNVIQMQVLLGCVLPSQGQLASLGVLEKNKEQDKEPTILMLSTPSMSSWFVLLPTTSQTQVPSQSRSSQVLPPRASSKSKLKKSENETPRATASSIFSGLKTDWFS